MKRTAIPGALLLALSACGSSPASSTKTLTAIPSAVVGTASAQILALRRTLVREATRLGDSHPISMFVIGPSTTNPGYTLIAKGVFHDPLNEPNGRGGVLCVSASARTLNPVAVEVGPADLCARTSGMALDITQPGAPQVSHTVLRTIFLHAAINCGDRVPTDMTSARTTVEGAYRHVYGTTYKSVGDSPAADSDVYVLTGRGAFNCHFGAGGDMPHDHGGQDLTIVVVANDLPLKPWEITYKHVDDIAAPDHRSASSRSIDGTERATRSVLSARLSYEETT